MPTTKKKKRPAISEIAGYLRQHADAVFKMPASEQFIGARDTAFHSAMYQIADALEQLAGHRSH
jgi:hypothetical protein